ncbi:hypothetical protein PRIPAC_80985, partial [Pristionchus pacificus]|uniref:G protein-coupled receptor n=1 Tax=Pristionchus pacificus TaxID=54126 RepID=A0A2A6CL55_PRIPA
MLLVAILFRTPLHMRVYSRILGACAVCDIAGLVAMMVSVTKEQLFEFASMLEFDGVCTLWGIDACCIACSSLHLNVDLLSSFAILRISTMRTRCVECPHAPMESCKLRDRFHNTLQFPADSSHAAFSRQDPAISSYKILRLYDEDKVIGLRYPQKFRRQNIWSQRGVDMKNEYGHDFQRFDLFSLYRIALDLHDSYANGVIFLRL